MLKKDDLPPHLRQHVASPQPELEAELVEMPVAAPDAGEPADAPVEPYLRTS